MELALAEGRPLDALDMLNVRLATVGSFALLQLLPLGARAAADLAEQSRDRDDPAAEREAQRRLDELDAYRSRVLNEAGATEASDSPVEAALLADFAAESARCRARPDRAEAWSHAVAAWQRVGFAWNAAYASWRRAEALLARGAGHADAAASLRHAYTVARDLGAAPLREDVVALARIARISLDVPAQRRPEETVPVPFDLLTPREHEVLAHLVAGRTYREIADDLVVSEKTVSVHVSHILRKTGTRSRVQVAALARRVGVGDRSGHATVLPAQDAAPRPDGGHAGRASAGRDVGHLRRTGR